MDNKKVALITGSTDGIGKATALKLLKEGWEVVINGRNNSKCEATINELKQKSKSNNVTAFIADLSNLDQVKTATEKFLEMHSRLDLLMLNANSIANDRIVTSEGNEQNFALGYLSRVLMIERFQDILEETPNAQILSVVGMDYSRIDFEDLTIEKDFTGRKGLTRWQWAMNVFTRNYKSSGMNTVPLNLYMPGLVKTKILANEPQPGRTFVKIMNMIVGISVEKAAENIFTVINEITNKHKTGTCYSWKTERSFPKVEIKKDDQQKLLDITDKLLSPFL